jgi:hypothetical protein
MKSDSLTEYTNSFSAANLPRLVSAQRIKTKTAAGRMTIEQEFKMRNSFFKRHRPIKPNTPIDDGLEEYDEMDGDENYVPMDTFGFSEFKFNFGIALKINTLHPNFQKVVAQFRVENPRSPCSDAEVVHEMAHWFILSKLTAAGSPDFPGVDCEMIIGGVEQPRQNEH